MAARELQRRRRTSRKALAAPIRMSFRLNDTMAATADPRPSTLAIWSALSVVYIIWGSTYLAIRFTVETMPPFLSAAARFTISGAFLYFWRRLSGDPAPTSLERRNAAVVGLFLLVGGNGGVVWAVQYIPSSLAALLVATVPLWMILIDALRPGGVRPGPTALIGILIGLAGAIVLIGWTAANATSTNLTGAIVVLAASLLWAIGSIYAKTAMLPSSSLLTTGIEMLAGGLVQIGVAFLAGEFFEFDVSAVTSRSAFAWVYLTVIGTGAFIAYAWLLRVAPIPLVATYSYVNPLVAILLGYFLGKELITPRILLAAGLIIGSVVLVSRAPRPRNELSPDKLRE
ncbi:MAG TPA: EamA family transporter [Candidatus Saccharimonadales bacterium]|nr:EamA family transporter [Candidatus Saccharimonadales bacterium]